MNLNFVNNFYFFKISISLLKQYHKNLLRSLLQIKANKSLRVLAKFQN